MDGLGLAEADVAAEQHGAAKALLRWPSCHMEPRGFAGVCALDAKMRFPMWPREYRILAWLPEGGGTKDAFSYFFCLANVLFLFVSLFTCHCACYVLCGGFITSLPPRSCIPIPSLPEKIKKPNSSSFPSKVKKGGHWEGPMVVPKIC